MKDIIDVANDEIHIFGRPSANTSNELINEIKTLRKKIDEAQNCLVCASIADSYEICTNTYEILK